MINLKSTREIKLMRKAGRIAAAARELAREMALPGVRTNQIDMEIRKLIVKSGAVPSFLGYRGFPASVCISLNSEVIHGIPGERIIREGDIVSIDVGACVEGYHGDCAGSFIAGKGSPEAEKLVEVTRKCFFEGIKYAHEGCRVSDIGHAIQEYAESNGYSLVREYVGHGIGSALHESPEVPNFGEPGRGVRLLEGMTIAIEPMVNAGQHDVKVLKDKWTVVTADGSLSAHYENTILITDAEPELLTVAEGA